MQARRYQPEKYLFQISCATKENATQSAFEKEGLFNLAKTMVSVLHKGLYYKVEKFKYKRLEVLVMHPRIKNKSELPVGE